VAGRDEHFEEDRMTDPNRWLIGELAKRAGLSAKAVRYYESVGLLGESVRTESGYRTYGPPDLERLQFIQAAKMLGLRLDEVKDVLDTWSSGTAPCGMVAKMVDEKLAELDRRIEQMTRFRDELRGYMAKVEASGGPSNVPCRHIHGVAAGDWKPSAPVPEHNLKDADGAASSKLVQIEKPRRREKP
jgi:MerR family transcriptional regulator, copper efflux regulator